MWLDFGNEKSWSASNFVLIDGSLAPFTPKSDFSSVPNINFKWLSDQNITRNLPITMTSSGLIVINSASHVDLYYHAEKIKGLNLLDMCS